MADLTAVAATYSNAGAAQANIGANFKRAVVSYPGTAVAAATPFSAMGTRQLTFLKVTADGDTPFATSTFGDANSSANAVLQGIMAYAEVYHFQRVSDTVLAFTIGEDTANDFDSDNSTVGYGKMETTIKATENAISGNSTTFTVAAASLS